MSTAVRSSTRGRVAVLPALVTTALITLAGVAAPDAAATTAATTAAPAVTAVGASTAVTSGAVTSAVTAGLQQRGATCTGAVRVRCVWSSYSGGSFAVPAGVGRVHIEARGGAGGDGRFGGDGGRGSVLTADFAVSRGQQLDVVVGEQGRRGFTQSTLVPGGNGAGRGGRGGTNPAPHPVTYAGGGGGGASRVGLAGQALIVAGGGGGGGGRGSLTSRGGDGQPSGPSTINANGADGIASAGGDSGSGGGGGGVRGGQAGRPGDDGKFYSSGSSGGHAGTSTSPAGSYFREDQNPGDGAVVITFDEPTDQHTRPELGITLTTPERVVIGRPFTITLTATNRGGIAFTDVSTRTSFGAFLRDAATGADPDTGWDVGPVPAYGTATRDYTVVAPRVGRQTITALGTGHGPIGTDADHARASVLAITPTAAGQ